jgi:hypothetical protein
LVGKVDGAENIWPDPSRYRARHLPEGNFRTVPN